jgi:hypothetical protein
MTTRFDVLSPRPGKDGKTYWLKVGAQFLSKDGQGWTIKLDALPLPDKEGNIWLSCKEPRERDAASTPAPRGSLTDQLDDDIPFG